MAHYAFYDHREEQAKMQHRRYARRLLHQMGLTHRQISRLMNRFHHTQLVITGPRRWRLSQIIHDALDAGPQPE